MISLIDALLEAGRLDPPDAVTLGRSRQGRAIEGYRFGTGPLRVSLLGGCHADEPVGPGLLKNLCRHLATLEPDDPLLTRYEWWIVPHINPDGEHRNGGWYSESDTEFDMVRYLAGVVREPPGEDIEFGFPTGEDDPAARPETRAVYSWWLTAGEPFHLHVSLHGMAFAGGPWFLIDEAWRERCDELMDTCRREVERHGYRLHDVERNGEKGFFRIAPGFTTRPDSRYMRAHFEERGEPDTAQLFRPSSMEAIRDLGGDPLTLVTEMPLFILPGVGEELGPPDPVALQWQERIAAWRSRIQAGDTTSLREEIARSGTKPMPLADQMRFQWTLIAAGIKQIELEESRKGGT